MTKFSNEQWEAYYWCHRDLKKLSYEAAAKKMGVMVDEVEQLMMKMSEQEPSLFTDITSDRRRFDHKVERFSPTRHEGHVKQVF